MLLVAENHCHEGTPLRNTQGHDNGNTPYLQGSGAQDACSFILRHVSCGDSGPIGGLCLLFEDLHALLSFRKSLLGPILLIICLQAVPFRYPLQDKKCLVQMPDSLLVMSICSSSGGDVYLLPPLGLLAHQSLQACKFGKPTSGVCHAQVHPFNNGMVSGRLYVHPASPPKSSSSAILQRSLSATDQWVNTERFRYSSMDLSMQRNKGWPDDDEDGYTASSSLNEASNRAMCQHVPSCDVTMVNGLREGCVTL